MTMAITQGRRGGDRRRHLRLDRQHERLGRRLRGQGGHAAPIVVIPEGKIAMGKLAQAVAYGAHVISIPGNFDVALEVVREAAERLPIALVNSVNPYRIEGQKTGAFEIVRRARRRARLPRHPGRQRRQHHRLLEGLPRVPRGGRQPASLPKMLGFQAAGAAPLVLGHVIEKPETIATAIRIGNPARGEEALAAARDSRRLHRHGDRRGDPRRLQAGRRAPRACSASRPRRPRSPGVTKARADGRVPGRRARRLHPHRPRPEGPRHGGAHGQPSPSSPRTRCARSSACSA